MLPLFLLLLVVMVCCLIVCVERDRLRANLHEMQTALDAVKKQAVADRQAASNASELRTDLALIERERAQIVGIAADYAERVRVLTYAGNELAAAATHAAGALEGSVSTREAERLRERVAAWIKEARGGKA